MNYREVVYGFHKGPIRWCYFSFVQKEINLKVLSLYHITRSLAKITTGVTINMLQSHIKPMHDSVTTTTIKQ